MTPGEAELAEQELGLAAEALREALVLIDAGAPRGAISRLYYAAFHAARAVLAVRGLYTKTHSGQINLFTRILEPAPLLGRLFELRAAADYGEAKFVRSLEEVRDLATEAAIFVERCRELVSDAITRGADEPDPPPDL